VVKHEPNRSTALKINKGLLYTTTRSRESKTYNVKNRSEHERTVLIEHPFRQGFNIVSKDKPKERSRDVYRFELKIAAGKTASQEVAEECDVTQAVSLTNSDDQQIRIFVQDNAASPKLKEALQQAIGLRTKVAATQRELQQQQKLLGDITQDQVRLRANLKEMPQTAAAYKRYLDKFDKQETEIEKLQATIKELQEADHQQKKDYETFLGALDVE